MVFVFLVEPLSNSSGLLRQPKYGHLKELHTAIKMCEPALVSSDPAITTLGSSQEVIPYMYLLFLI